MEMRSALIVGVGSGLSASLARLFAKNGLQVALASRNPDRLAALAQETAAATFACEAAEPEEVGGLFDAVIATQGVPDVVVYNASRPRARAGRRTGSRGGGARDRGQRLCRLPGRPAGGAPHAAARLGRDPVHRRVRQSVKGYPLSAAFAMGKFALRGLAQSMARELAPQGIHVAHFVIDGAIRNPGPHRAGGQAGQHARSRRDRRELLACRAAAAQRLDLGDGTAALGRAVLSGVDRRIIASGLGRRRRADGRGVRHRAAAVPRVVRGVHHGRCTVLR